MVVIEVMWEIELVLVSFIVVVLINQCEQKNDWVVEILWVMGLIGMCLVFKQILGIYEIKVCNCG